jgi:hypothetical protein
VFIKSVWTFYEPSAAVAHLDERVFIFCIILSGARLSPLGTAATIGLLYQTRMIDDDDCGAIGGM